jgi:hypothetical protein
VRCSNGERYRCGVFRRLRDVDCERLRAFDGERFSNVDCERFSAFDGSRFRDAFVAAEWFRCVGIDGVRIGYVTISLLVGLHGGERAWGWHVRRESTVAKRGV